MYATRSAERSKTIRSNPESSLAQRPTPAVSPARSDGRAADSAPGSLLYAVAPPAFRLSPTTAESGSSQPEVIQRMAFDRSGQVVGRFDFLTNYYDTEKIRDFSDWLDQLHRNKQESAVDSIYRSLDAKQNRSRGEAIALSKARSVLDKLNRKADAKRKDTSVLGALNRDRWSKIFIEGQHQGHDTGEMYFDRDQSPGYYAAMMKTFERELLPKQNSDERLTFDDYDRMHRQVTRGVMRDTRTRSWLGNQIFESVPHEISGRTTMFPMSLPGQDVSNDSLVEMLQDDDLGLSRGFAHRMNMPNAYDQFGSDTATSTWSLRATTSGQQHMVTTNYDQASVPGKVNALFDRYYAELQRVKTSKFDPKKQKKAKLKAIVRLVRALHVGHFFTDANGRLNTMLLLNKLLLTEGFDLAIMHDTAIFGGRMSSDDLVEKVEEGMKTFYTEMMEGAEENYQEKVRGKNTEDDQESVGRVVRATPSMANFLLQKTGEIIEEGAPIALSILVTYGYQWLTGEAPTGGST
jgi:hypothetical protein